MFSTLTIYWRSAGTEQWQLLQWACDPFQYILLSVPKKTFVVALKQVELLLVLLELLVTSNYRALPGEKVTFAAIDAEVQ